jgi:putative acetyltransferase
MSNAAGVRRLVDIRRFGSRRASTLTVVEIRAARRSERAEIEGVVAAAFGEDSDGPVVRMIRALDQTGATRLSLVADEDEIVGHVQLSRAWIDTRSRLVEALMLTPLSVSPDVQRQGIGTRLLREALDTADGLGVAAVFLEGDWNYYGSRGFVAASSLDLLRPSQRIPERAFQVATLSGYEPSMSGQVVYPDAMWETDSVGLRDPRLATIENTATGPVHVVQEAGRRSAHCEHP